MRAIINIYRDGDYVGVVYATVPTHLGRLFVPKDVLEKVEEEGDQFELIIQLRTNDNNNRTYSKSQKLKLK